MHLFPYIDSLWFGEGFDLEQRGMGPDYWLVEMSGVPFGLPSELMAPGNPWRGMLHGSHGWRVSGRGVGRLPRPPFAFGINECEAPEASSSA